MKYHQRPAEQYCLVLAQLYTQAAISNKLMVAIKLNEISITHNSPEASPEVKFVIPSAAKPSEILLIMYRKMAGSSVDRNGIWSCAKHSNSKKYDCASFGYTYAIQRDSAHVIIYSITFISIAISYHKICLWNGEYQFGCDI